VEIDRGLPMHDTDLRSVIPLRRLTAGQDELLRVAFVELLRRSEPVPVSVLAELCDPTGLDTAAELELLAAAGRLGRGADGSVTGALGLTVDRTPHELLIGDTPWHTWCVIDALGILGGLGASGSVTSASPGTGLVLTVRFTEGRLSGGDTDCVVFVPGYREGTPVIRTWCPWVNFFPDAVIAERWASTHAVPGQAVTLATAAAVACRHWSDRLRPASP